MRKSSYVKTITGKDVKSFNLLNITGCATPEQLYRYCNITEQRLEKLCNSNFLERKDCVQEGRYYMLKDKGSAYCSFSKYHFASAKHDIALTEQYLNLTDEQQEKVVSVQDYCRERGISFSVKGTPDLIIEYSFEQVEFIEIITNSYKSEDIELKRNFALEQKATLKLIKAENGLEVD